MTAGGAAVSIGAGAAGTGGAGAAGTGGTPIALESERIGFDDGAALVWFGCERVAAAAWARRRFARTLSRPVFWV